MNKTLILLATFLFSPQFIHAQTKVSDDEFIANLSKRLEMNFKHMEKQLPRFLSIDGNTNFNSSKEKYLTIKLEEAVNIFSDKPEKEREKIFRDLWQDPDYHELQIALPARDVIKNLELMSENFYPHIMIIEAKKLRDRIKTQNVDIRSNALKILKILKDLENKSRKTGEEISDRYEVLSLLGRGEVIRAMGIEDAKSAGMAKAAMAVNFKLVHDVYESIIWCLIQPRSDYQTACY